jgi:hypothetical protein
MRRPLAGINRATGRPFSSDGVLRSRLDIANASSERPVRLAEGDRLALAWSLQQCPATLLNKHPNVIASEAKQSGAVVLSRVEIASLRSQ